MRRDVLGKSVLTRTTHIGRNHVVDIGLVHPAKENVGQPMSKRRPILVSKLYTLAAST